MFPHFHHLILAHPAPPSLPPAIVFEEKWLTDNSRAQKQELKVGDCMIFFLLSSTLQLLIGMSYTSVEVYGASKNKNTEMEVPEIRLEK